uniref:Uncharacterized protein n=1 Tax=Scleropages formosus TaxID=113540 RepID=A0A8C9TRN3_SCLFO
RGGLVQQQRHGLRLLRLGHEHGVTAQHHRLVLHLVPVDPREHLGQARVRHAVRDAVQQVQVARPARPLVRTPLTGRDAVPRVRVSAAPGRRSSSSACLRACARVCVCVSGCSPWPSSAGPARLP